MGRTGSKKVKYDLWTLIIKCKNAYNKTIYRNINIGPQIIEPTVSSVGLVLLFGAHCSALFFTSALW